MTLITVPVSLGELLDKYSILEIKKCKLHNDKNKINDISNEINVLAPYVHNYCSNIEYKLLRYINLMIWDLNEKYNELDIFDGKEIMNTNNSRFRVKNIINTIYSSNIKEVKSYKTNAQYIIIDSSLSLLKDILIIVYWELIHYEKLVVIIQHADSVLLTTLESIFQKIDVNFYNILKKEKYYVEYKDLLNIPTCFINIIRDHNFY